MAEFGDLRAASSDLLSVLEKAGSPVVFCHNDLLCGNVVVNRKAGMWVGCTCVLVYMSALCSMVWYLVWSSKLDRNTCGALSHQIDKLCSHLCMWNVRCACVTQLTLCGIAEQGRSFELKSFVATRGASTPKGGL